MHRYYHAYAKVRSVGQGRLSTNLENGHVEVSLLSVQSKKHKFTAILLNF